MAIPAAANVGEAMACDDHIYSPRGRGGLGVVQPQSGLDYPFVAPSEDIRYLVADLYFAYDDAGLYDDTVQQAQHPLKIKWLYGVGCQENSAPEDAPTPTHAADILIVDANDYVVFDSTEADKFSDREWGADYHIYEWQSDTAVCRIVVYTTWAPDESAVRYYTTHITPAAAILDERAVYKIPKRITAITVLNTKITNAATDLVCGYNIGMVTTPNVDRGFRHTNQIEMLAEPGLGIGRYSDCNDEPPNIVLLNGATGPDITITATDCLWTRIDTEFNDDATALIVNKLDSANPIIYPNGTTNVLLGSNCPACCDCLDYVNSGRYMNCVRDRYAIIGDRAHEVLLQHTSNIARWVEQRECRIQKPLKVVMTPQLCPAIDVVVQFCNLCEKCAEDVNVFVQFDTYPSGGSVSVEHCYTVLSAGSARNFPYYMPTIAANGFAVNFGKVSAGNSADISFRVAVSPDRPATVTATVTGTKKENDAIVPIRAGCGTTGATASATASAALACDNNGNTVSVC